MNSLSAIAMSSSLLSALLTTGCFSLLVPDQDGRLRSPYPEASETAQIRTNLGSLTRGQQAYYLENGRFATTIEDIGIGIRPGEGGYQVAIADLQPTKVILTATPEQLGNPNFTAGVFVVNAPGGSMTVAVQCESDTGVPVPRLAGNEAICDEAQ